METVTTGLGRRLTGLGQAADGLDRRSCVQVLDQLKILDHRLHKHKSVSEGHLYLKLAVSDNLRSHKHRTTNPDVTAKFKLT